MSVYTVHEPPQRDLGASVDPERFVFVRDGFYFWAMIFGPIWLLWRRLWLALLFYVIAWIIGRRRALVLQGRHRRGGRDQLRLRLAARHGGLQRVALDAERARLEKSSASWSATIWNPPSGVSFRSGASGRKRHAASKPAVLTNYGPKSADGASEVIGLFPEPGGPR